MSRHKHKTASSAPTGACRILVVALVALVPKLCLGTHVGKLCFPSA